MSEIKVMSSPSPAMMDSILVYYGSISIKNPSFMRDRDFLSHCLEHPDISPENIFVAIEDKKVMGVAIVTVSQGKELLNGNILEISYSNQFAGKALLNSAISYCKNKDADVIYCAPPLIDSGARLFKDGWVDISGVVLMMANMTSAADLLQALLTQELSRKFQRNGRFYIALERSTLFPEEVLEINLTRSKTTVSAISIDNFYNADIRLKRTTLLKIVLSGLNPYRALLTGKVKVKNVRRIPVLLGLLRSLAIPRPWIVQLIDVA